MKLFGSIRKLSTSIYPAEKSLQLYAPLIVKKSLCLYALPC
jgi:hypothetical protein